jgi:hypothetical protein
MLRVSILAGLLLLLAGCATSRETITLDFPPVEYSSEPKQ